MWKSEYFSWSRAKLYLLKREADMQYVSIKWINLNEWLYNIVVLYMQLVYTDSTVSVPCEILLPKDL